MSSIVTGCGIGTLEPVNCTPSVAAFLSFGLAPSLLERRRRFPPPPLPGPSVPVGAARGVDVDLRAGFAFLLTLLLGAPFGGILGIVCQS